MTTPPTLTEGTKRKKRRLSSKNATPTQEVTKVKKKRSLQPVSMSTSPNTSRSSSPSQPVNDLITPVTTTTNTNANTTKRSIRAASAAINKREQDKESSVEPSLSSEPTSPTKRSIRAASDAISKRELEKKLSVNTSPSDRDESPIAEEKKPVVKRRRKLNIQKSVVVPNADSPSDEIELEGAALNSYSKYLNPNKTTSTVMPITLGVNKKRKMISRKSNAPTQHKESSSSAYTTDTPITTTTEEEQLDLSQHVILPNSSYIAHLRHPARSSMDSGSVNYYSDQSSNTSNKSSPTSEFYDAASDFDGQKDVFMSSLDEDDSTTEYMDFEYKSPTEDMIVDALPTEKYVDAEPKKGFWKSVLTFARFANDR